MSRRPPNTTAPKGRIGRNPAVYLPLWLEERPGSRGARANLENGKGDLPNENPDDPSDRGRAGRVRRPARTRRPTVRTSSPSSWGRGRSGPRAPPTRLRAGRSSEATRSGEGGSRSLTARFPSLNCGANVHGIRHVFWVGDMAFGSNWSGRTSWTREHGGAMDAAWAWVEAGGDVVDVPPKALFGPLPAIRTFLAGRRMPRPAVAHPGHVRRWIKCWRA